MLRFFFFKATTLARLLVYQYEKENQGWRYKYNGEQRAAFAVYSLITSVKESYDNLKYFLHSTQKAAIAIFTTEVLPKMEGYEHSIPNLSFNEEALVKNMFNDSSFSITLRNNFAELLDLVTIDYKNYI